MKSASVNDKSQMPVLGEIPLLGNLFKQTARGTVKKELVILLKPTIVRNGDWSQDILQSQQRIQAMQRSEGGSASVR